MERLTNSNIEIKTLRSENEAYWLNAYFKLKEYEDAEEQGLLIRLPCKVGDVFWELNRLAEPTYCYPRRVLTLTHCVYVLNRLGKTVFLTKEEAEAALERMAGK